MVTLKVTNRLLPYYGLNKSTKSNKLITSSKWSLKLQVVKARAYRGSSVELNNESWSIYCCCCTCCTLPSCPLVPIIFLSSMCHDKFLWCVGYSPNRCRCSIVHSDTQASEKSDKSDLSEFGLTRAHIDL